MQEDRVNDIALLKVEGKFKALPIAEVDNVKLGDAVFTVGFPMVDIQGTSPKLTRGEICSLYGIRDDKRMYQISVPIQRGNSGGPLINQKGNVIGIITLMLNSDSNQEAYFQNVNYATKINGAYFLIEKVKGLKEKLAKPTSWIESFFINSVEKSVHSAVFIIAGDSEEEIQSLCKQYLK